MRRRGLLEGVRAMTNRIYAGQNWWLNSSRSNIECLYRRGSQASPTRYIIAIAGEGTTADRHTGDWQPTQGTELKTGTGGWEWRNAEGGYRYRGDGNCKGIVYMCQKGPHRREGIGGVQSCGLQGRG